MITKFITCFVGRSAGVMLVTKLFFNFKALVDKAVLFLFLLPIFFLGSNSRAAEDHALVICRKEKAVRTLRVEVSAPEKCRTLYAKSGVEQSIGQNTKTASCIEYSDGVRATLEGAGWVCKQIKQSTQNEIPK